MQKWVLATAVLLFAVKILAWFLTGSLAILTDGLESIVNIVAGGLGLYGLRVSVKPPDANHPYGHGKAEFVSAGMEGLLVIGAGVFIVYKAVESLFTKHEIVAVDTGIYLIILTAAVNFVLGKMCMRRGKDTGSDQLLAAGKHLQADVWSSVAVVLGLMAIYFTGIQYLDSLIAAIVAVFIITNGIAILRSSVGGIMDRADEQLLKKIVDLLNDHRPENWIDIHNMRIIKYGSTLHCDCHLTVPWYLSVREGHAEIEALAALIRNHFGGAVEFFVHADPCVDFSCRICEKQHCAVRQHPFEQRVKLTIRNISEDNKHRLQEG